MQPQRVRNFARSQGLIAKTDGIDAALIARFGALSNPRRFTKVDRACVQLRALMDHRRHLGDKLTRESRRLATAPATLRALIQRHIQWLEKQIGEIEEQIEVFSAQNSELREKEERMRRIQGVGPILSRTLLARMRQIGRLSSKQVAALAAVAPYNRNSATITVASTRHNPVLGNFYQRLRKNGKPSKVALTAVMRKLIILINNVIKNPDSSLS